MTTDTRSSRHILTQWIRQKGWESVDDFISDQLDAGIKAEDIPERLQAVLEAEEPVVTARTIYRWLKRAGWEAQAKERTA